MNIQYLLNKWRTATELVIVTREEREVLMAVIKVLKGE